jgi:hypothetical protein
LCGELETAPIRVATVTVPWDVKPPEEPQHNLDPLQGPLPGPIGEYLEVIDYDPANRCYYPPVDLNDPILLAQDGTAPSDSDPRFHQQMVYAVAMRTIRLFENALGRRVLWAPRIDPEKEGRKRYSYVPRLRIYPHALREANAYYSPAKKALLFGYFQATPADAAKHMPGATVYTCLSHDVVVHETAHALLDGMHRRMTEPSNPDVLAFHEAFADIVAFFQHFTLTDVVRHEIARHRGTLRAGGLLSEIAKELGQATSRGKALRSALDEKPDPLKIREAVEPHERGAILVAAVYGAFVSIYEARTKDLFRLASRGTGILEGEIPPDLVERLTTEAVKTARHVLAICIRALDYLPPVDVTFGDYFRALVTADYDLVPDDPLHYRVAFIESFRKWGIFPHRLQSLSEESLLWDRPDVDDTYRGVEAELGEFLKKEMECWDLECNRSKLYDKMENLRAEVHRKFKIVPDNKRELLSQGIEFPASKEDVRAERKFEIHEIRPIRRTAPGNQLQLDAVVLITQRTKGFLDGTLADALEKQDAAEFDFWFRNGCTLIVDLKTGKPRYCIYKKPVKENRYEEWQNFFRKSSNGGSSYFAPSGIQKDEREEIFSFLHRAVKGESK